MAEARAKLPLSIGRRPLDRLRTADFISQTDVITIIIVIFTIFSKTGQWSSFVRFPWWIVTVGATLLFVRMIVLTILSGSMRKLSAGALQIVNSFYSAFTGSVTDEEDPAWPLVARLRNKSGGPLSKTDTAWYSLLTIGIIGMVMIVGGSGGFTGSPFRDILVATFILGQFRAPTARGIWALFGYGIVAVTSASLLYSFLRHYDPSPFKAVNFGVAYDIAPVLMVGFFSTMVYWLTFRRETKRRRNEPDTSDGA